MIVSGEAPFLINVADLSFFPIARPRSHLRSLAPNVPTFDQQLHVLRLKSLGGSIFFSSKLRMKHLPGHHLYPLWTSLSAIDFLPPVAASFYLCLSSYNIGNLIVLSGNSPVYLLLTFVHVSPLSNLQFLRLSFILPNIFSRTTSPSAKYLN